MNMTIFNLQKFIYENQIKQIILSDGVTFEDIKQIKVSFNYKNNLENTIFFGVFNTYDICNIKSHKGQKWILWSGSDSNYLSSFRKNIVFDINIDNIDNITLDNSHNNLEKLKINHFNITDNKYYNYDLNFENIKTNIFKNIKNIYILNLERRLDKKLFMKFKLSNIGINNYEFFNAIDGNNDEECNNLFKNFINSIQPIDFISKIPFMQKKSNFAILKSYKKLYEKIICDNYKEDDYIIIFEDDICFNKDIKDMSLNLDKDIIYLGSNEYSNKILKNINNKDITYGAYGICYKIKFIKRFYNKYFLNFSNLRKPYDYLLWEFINNENISNKIIYPNIIIPNLKDSDNMKSRNIFNISKIKNWDLLNYKLLDLELLYYDIYNKVIDNDINLRLFSNKNINNLSYYELSKIIEGNSKSYVLIVNNSSNFEFEILLTILKKQSYPFWRVYYVNKKFDYLVRKYKFNKKIKYINKEIVNTPSKFLSNYKKNFYEDDYVIFLNIKFKLPNDFFENLNKSNLKNQVYFYDNFSKKLNVIK